MENLYLDLRSGSYPEVRHSTLSRTRKRLPATVFETCFQHILTACVEKGMVSGHTQVVDAAFVEANASTDSMKRKALLEWQLFQGEAKQITPADLFGQASSFTALEKRAKPKSCPRNNRTHICISDVDAKLTQKAGKVSRLYYLSSMAVDTYRHVITHIQADLADEKDSRHLMAIVDKLARKLNQYGLPFQYLLADAGFSSGENGPATCLSIGSMLHWRHATSKASFRFMAVTIRIDHGIGSIKGRIHL